MNDVASAHVISRDYEQGILVYQEIIDRAERMPNMEESLIAFYYNLGEVSPVIS